MFVIDYKQVERLARISCTHEEIASILDCDHATLAKDEKFLALYKKHSDGGKMSLRRAQFAAANSGNVSAMIWLGKQLLKQRDTPPEDGGKELPPVKVEIVFKDARKKEGAHDNDEG